MTAETQFSFSDITGQSATISVNARGNHVAVTWGALVVCETSGYIGFWETFKCGNLKGAAYTAALRKHARTYIEFEIYEAFKFAQENQA